MDPVFFAMSCMRRRCFQDCIDVCTGLLMQNPRDLAVWSLKTHALASLTWIDDTEMEEEGLGEILLDENAVASVPRPGTSFAAPKTGAGSGADAAIRPVSRSGRPLTGFARPGTGSARPGTGSIGMEQALKLGRGGTAGGSRPMTTLGRQVRLGTASMVASGSGTFIDVHRLDLKKYATRPALAKALCDFTLYHDHNPRKALELAAAASVACGYQDWWWKARLGKCYYQLGLLRDAEKQFKSALREQPMVAIYLELTKVYVKLDQPLLALELLGKACEAVPADATLLVARARVHDMLGDAVAAGADYKAVLKRDPSNVEAMASLAANHFYADQPEVALRFYRRLLQMGCAGAELHNNLGLCCFYAAQYDMALSCFERALALADDSNMADVWYNIAQVATGIGDLKLAYQALRIAASVDATHAESHNNLGVLELRKGRIEAARSHFRAAQELGEHMHEPHFNSALLAYKLGELESSYAHAEKSKAAYAAHSDTRELLKQLESHFGTT
eukprot:g8212.t1